MLLPIGRVIATVAVVYAALVALFLGLWWQCAENPTVLGGLGFALKGATPIQLMLMTFIYYGWTWIWKVIPKLNEWLFPDLNGTWNMEIRYNLKDKSGRLDAEATIKQNFVSLSMDVRAPSSDSQTLLAVPRKDPESRRPMLYYVYSVTPHATGPKPARLYTGAAILRFDTANGGELGGNYWTSAETTGRFTLHGRRQ
jgi:hypothetical protein